MPVNNQEAKAWAREKVRGLWTTPMIPMLDDGSIDHEGIRHNVEYMLGIGVGGMGFGFSEPWYLTIAERREAFKTFVESVAGRVPCYVHAVDYSVPETVALIKYAGDIGADSVMIWVPMEFAKTEGMALDWYEYIASQVQMPIFAYNTYHSGINLSMDAIRRLAAVENIVALKDAVNDFGHTIAALDAVGDQILVSNPLEEYLPAMLTYTNQQVMLGTTSVFLMQSPRLQPINDYVKLIEQGKVAEAWAAYYALKPLRDIWTSIYAVLWDKEAAMHPIATIKYWMDLMGMRGGTVRPPLKPLSDDAKAAFKARLEATGWYDQLRVGNDG
ncbi:MAG: 4-hydroxy-tetrahydrodipicolinate synthase [Chloroflexota bacterium]|jgi:4-hydroxy-tetrahydrodipicolinate synthase|nr:4-hydroxy-tetrahydrodipicolinate synthase [Chloroflexota bacterium]